MDQIDKIKKWIKENWLWVVCGFIIIALSNKFHIYYQLLLLMIYISECFIFKIYINLKKIKKKQDD